MAGHAVLRQVLPFLALAAFSRGAMINPIQLPTGRWGLSSVDNSQKNSGGDSGQDGLGPTGYIGYNAIASNRGVHLASAASSIRSINATAAMALEKQTLTEGGQVKISDQAMYRETLGTFLTYHGGKTMSLPYNMSVYLIFYGTWSKRQRNVVRTFVASLDAKNYPSGLRNQRTLANWWLINNKYYHNKQQQPITPNIRLGGVVNFKSSTFTAGMSRANPLTQRHVHLIVQRALDPRRRNHLPIDPNGAYAVFTDKTLFVQDFCTALCAFHTSSTFFGRKLAYLFVGNPEIQCPLQCTYRYFDPTYQPPHKDLGIDAVCDKLGHELSELTTNTLHGPNDLAGWAVGNSNVEICDLCEWEYGKVNFEKDNTVWNLRGFNNQKFLVQQNWDRLERKCVSQYNQA